jgi:hypothetical protein
VSEGTSFPHRSLASPVEPANGTGIIELSGPRITGALVMEVRNVTVHVQP